jgi:hypothetical protein
MQSNHPLVGGVESIHTPPRTQAELAARLATFEQARAARLALIIGEATIPQAVPADEIDPDFTTPPTAA